MMSFKIATLVVAASAFATDVAHAQWYASTQQSPPPLYPYQMQVNAPRQPFAVQVAPGQYVIHRPEDDTRPSRERRHEPRNVRQAPAPAPVAKAVRTRTKTDPALVEELRQRAAGKSVKPKAENVKPEKADSVINTRKVVRLPPKVVETKRYVDVPPRVVEQYTVVDDATGQKKVLVEAPQSVVQPADAPMAKSGKPDKGDGKKRVIQADAEITVIGPDRMTIQLYRKGERGRNLR